MKVIVVLAHPCKKSLNHAIAATTVNALKENGHNVIYHDLCEEKFDPVMRCEELERQRQIEPGPDIKHYCNELQEADGIVIIHPNWWGKPPAILTGWLDRVFRPNVAFSVLREDSGIKTEGLLKQMTPVIINTSEVDDLETELRVYKASLDAIWTNCVFDLCETKKVTRKLFSGISKSTPEERKHWLEEVKEIINERFPA